MSADEGIARERPSTFMAVRVRGFLADRDRHPLALAQLLRAWGCIEVIVAIIVTSIAVAGDVFSTHRLGNAINDFFFKGAVFLIVALALFVLAYVVEMLHELVQLARWQDLQGRNRTETD